jgi:hypothetical protein
VNPTTTENAGKSDSAHVPSAGGPETANAGEDLQNSEPPLRDATRRKARMALIIWTLAAAVACIDRPQFALVRVLVEGTIYLALLAFIVRQKPVLQIIEGLSRARQIFLTALVGLLLFGQMHGHSGNTYPFATWDMYTRRLPPEQRYYEYTGVLADGREIRLNVSRRFNLLNRKFIIKLSTGADRILNGEPERRSKRIQEYEEMLQTIGNKFNQGVKGSNIVAVHVWRHTFSVEEFQRTGTTTRTLFWEKKLATTPNADAL